MKHVEINLGKVCNNNCLFCMSGNLRNMVSFGNAKAEVIKSAQNNYKSLGFLGGEVTIYPYIVDLVKIAKNNGFQKIHIISNGRKFADKDFLKELINAGVNRFSVSIHSHLESVEDYLTQKPGAFREKIKGIQNLINFKNQSLFKDNISINFVINKKNYQEILISLQYFVKLGINDFRFNYMWPEGNASKYYEELLIPYNMFAPYLNKIINLSKRLKVNIVFEGIPLCIFPKPAEQKKYLGELKDISTDVITYEENAIQKFNWQKRKIDSLKTKFDFCQQCKNNFFCEGVWQKYVDFYGPDEFKALIYE